MTHSMTTTSRLEGLCRLIGEYPSNVLPADTPPELAEKVIVAAINGHDLADAAGDVPVRRKFTVARLGAGDFDQVRRLVRRAQVKARWLDRQVSELQAELGEFERLLDPTKG